MLQILANPAFIPALQARTKQARIMALSATPAAAYRRARQLDMTRPVWMLFKPRAGHPGNRGVRDHINLSWENPLTGNTDPPRFPDMSSVYRHQDGPLCVAVQGMHEGLATFPEEIEQIEMGLWDSIALKHQGHTLEAWIVGDLERWIEEYLK